MKKRFYLRWHEAENKGKSLAIVSLMIGLMVLLAACGGGRAGEAGNAGNGGASGSPSDLNDRQVRIGEIVLSLDDEVAPLIEKLGDAKRFDEYPSCLFEGSDKLWEYESLTVQTYPEGDKDYILSIEILDDKPEIASGIKVGDSLKDLENAYGDRLKKESTGIYRVAEKGSGIDFYMDKEKVQGINLYLSLD